MVHLSKVLRQIENQYHYFEDNMLIIVLDHYRQLFQLFFYILHDIWLPFLLIIYL
jgi:hypothetical protein